MKAQFTKRLLAYIIDIIIVTTIAQFITGLIPVSEKSKASIENFKDLTNKVTEKQIDAREYSALLLNEQYTISRENVIQELITIVIYIVYFVVYSYKNDGVTLGKKIFKLKLKRKQEDKLTINSLMIRALILYNIALKIIDELLIVSLSKSNYIKSSQITGSLNIIIIIVIIFMVILRKDGRGLHDLISDTVVVSEEN